MQRCPGKKTPAMGDIQSECLVLFYVCWGFFHSHLGCVLCCGGRGYNKYMKDGVEPAAFASSGTTAGTSQFKDFPSPSKGMLDTLEDTDSTNLLSLKLTFSPLKMDGWKTRFFCGFRPIFRGENVSFRCRVT